MLSDPPEFEYHVQFPTPRPIPINKGDGDQNEQQNGVLISRSGDGGSDGASASGKSTAPVENIWPINTNIPNEKDIVVILLGWAGSQHKYLTKYSDIYLKRGCIVLRYITPIKMIFTNLDNLGTMTHQLLTVVQDLQLDGHPIFFHVFSNGGGVTYSSFLHEMILSSVQLDIRGTIFDSAPSPRSMKTCYKALINIYAGFKWPLGHLIAIGIVLIIMFKIFWYHLKTALNFCIKGDKVKANERCGTIRTEDGPSQNWLSRISHYRNHNFLFIYSEADELIPAEKVENFADILIKRQNHVKYLKFKDSAHVKHYLMHPNEYVDSVVRFIRGVMSSGAEVGQLNEAEAELEEAKSK